MSTVVLILLHAVAMQIAQDGNQLTLSLSGFALLLIFMAIGGYIGSLRGVRAILTVALGTIVAYIVCVQGGNEVVAVINRFWQNGPKLVAFAAGRNPAEVPPLDPLISPDLQVPLFFRFTFFIALIGIAWFFNKRSKWYAPGPVRHEPLAGILGVFAGALTALLWTNAAVIFWQEYAATGGQLAGPLTAILNILPDLSLFVPSLITIFMLILLLVVFFYLPRVVTVPEPPKR